MKRFFLLLGLLQLSWLHLVAQSACTGNFEAYNSQGQRVTILCKGEKIRFKACNPTIDPDKEYYDFDSRNGLSFPDTVKFHTFPSAGTYTVTQLINTSGNNQFAQNFTVVDAPVPIFSTQLCAQNQVSITISDRVYDSYTVDFGDGKTQSISRGEAVPLHRYTVGGSYNIRVTGNYTGANCSNFGITTIQTLPAATTPVLESAAITGSGANGSITLTWSGIQPAYYYLIEKVSNNTATVMDTIKNPAGATITHFLSDIDTRNSICFRIRTTDQCSTVLTAVSNLICTVPVTATTSNQNITLRWPAYPDPGQVLKFDVYRNGQVLTSLGATANTYQDNAVQCGTNYCYTIKAIIQGNSTATSNEVCATAVSTQAPLPGYLSSTFTAANIVQLTFVPTETTSDITYQKKAGNAAFTDLQVTTQLSINDAASNAGQPPGCYQAIFKNACNQVSMVSNSTCPIWLTVTSPRNGTAALNWSAYVGFPAGVQAYAIQTLDASGAVVQTIPVSSSLLQTEISVLENQPAFFRVRATGSLNSADETFSNTVNFIPETKIFIPTAFSPNGDHLNDLFEVKGQFLTSYRLLVYDRWGQVIFDNKNQLQGWDGRFNGKEIPTGAYPYRITGKDAAGKEFTKTGTVTLLR